MSRLTLIVVFFVSRECFDLDVDCKYCDYSELVDSAEQVMCQSNV